MEKYYTEIAVAIIGAFTTIMVAWITKIAKAVSPKERKKMRMSENLSNLATGLRILETQKDDPRSGIDRAIMFEGHDDGGEPRPEAPYYVDVIYPQIISDPNDKHLTQDEIVQKYSNLQVDSHYCYMLADLIKKKDIVLVVSEMPKCMLKTIYEIERVKVSIVSFVGIRDESIIFISQATFSDSLTEEQIFQAKLSANHLRSLIK